MAARLVRAATLLVTIAACFCRADCGTEQERIVRVREKLLPNIGDAGLTLLLQELVMGTRSCPTSGDLWYMRALLEERLKKDASYSRRQAETYPSDLLKRKLDPFRPLQLVAGGSGSGPVREKWALVVGIGEFQDAAVPALNFTVKDARDVYSYLTNGAGGHFKKDNVRLLVNEQATSRGIRAGIGWLRERVKKDDLVVIYVGSHGSPKTLDALGVSYILAHDTEIGSTEKLYSTSYQMVDFVDDLNRDIPASRMAVFIDACHSGAAVRQAETVEEESPDSAAGFSAAFRSFQLAPGRAVLTASRADEKSWESSTIGNGYFTHFLLEGLKQKNGRASLTEVADYVKEQVSNAVERDVHRPQHPVFSASAGGDTIVIGTPLTASAESVVPGAALSLTVLPPPPR